MFATTTHSRPDISFEQMRQFMHHGWGELGLRVADCWHDFNNRFFAGALRPVPILLVATSPHGHWLGLTCGGHSAVHRIELTYPGRKKVLVADRGVLLHEMVHQFLFESGVADPSHDSEPWRREITRLHTELTDECLWCAYDQVKKINGRSVRVPRPAPEPGMRAIPQKDIARWPYGVGINLGKL